MCRCRKPWTYRERIGRERIGRRDKKDGRGTMKDKTIPTIGALTGFLVAAGLSLATARPLRAENHTSAQTINLNAGQTQIIDHLKKDSKPAIRVIENPYALVIHDETPGQLLLLGAERGHWDVTITRDDNARVTYHVSIAALADRSV